MITETAVIMPAAADLQTSSLETILQDKSAVSSKYPEHLHHLTLQILHNLQHQHRWTDLEIYDEAPISLKSFPRPLILGLPPKRLYVHPDEQADILKKESKAREQRTDLTSEGDGEPTELEKPQKEWVLPSHIREKWSLKQFAEVFDAMDDIIPNEDKPWEEHKRVILATLQDDSTVVYYVMNDGVVKPRQN